MIRIVPLDRETAGSVADELLALGSDLAWDYWTREHLLADRPGKWEHSLLAMEGERPVGYAIASRKDASLHLHHIVIAPAMRARGVGREVMRRLIERAAADGCATLTLKVLGDNDRARAFYRGLGFSPAGEGGEYVTMALALEPA